MIYLTKCNWSAEPHNNCTNNLKHIGGEKTGASELMDPLLVQGVDVYTLCKSEAILRVQLWCFSFRWKGKLFTFHFKLLMFQTEPHTKVMEALVFFFFLFFFLNKFSVVLTIKLNNKPQTCIYCTQRAILPMYHGQVLTIYVVELFWKRSQYEEYTRQQWTCIMVHHCLLQSQ